MACKPVRPGGRQVWEVPSEKKPSHNDKNKWGKVKYPTPPKKKKEKLVKLKLEQTSIEKNATVKFMEPVKTTGF